MSARVLNLFRTPPRHRREVRVVQAGYPDDFRPRHCAGQDGPDGCVGHLHPGDVALPTWGGQP